MDRDQIRKLAADMAERAVRAAADSLLSLAGWVEYEDATDANLEAVRADMRTLAVLTGDVLSGKIADDAGKSAADSLTT